MYSFVAQILHQCRGAARTVPKPTMCQYRVFSPLYVILCMQLLQIASHTVTALLKLPSKKAPRVNPRRLALEVMPKEQARAEQANNS